MNNIKIIGKMIILTIVAYGDILGGCCGDGRWQRYGGRYCRCRFEHQQWEDKGKAVRHLRQSRRRKRREVSYLCWHRTALPPLSPPMPLSIYVGARGERGGKWDIYISNVLKSSNDFFVERHCKFKKRVVGNENEREVASKLGEKAHLIYALKL